MPGEGADFSGGKQDEGSKHEGANFGDDEGDLVVESDDCCAKCNDRVADCPIKRMMGILSSLNLTQCLLCAFVYPVAFAVSEIERLQVPTYNNTKIHLNADLILVPLTAPNIMLCAYTLICCGILGILEFIQLCQVCQNTDLGAAKMLKFLRSHFGFLFLHVGRAMFLIFVASLVVAGATTIVPDTEDIVISFLNYIIGFIAIVNAGVNMYLVCVHPDFKEGHGALGTFRPPTRVDDMTEEEKDEYMRKYLDMNPEIIEDLNSDEPQLTDFNDPGGVQDTTPYDPKPQSAVSSTPDQSNHGTEDPFGDEVASEEDIGDEGPLVDVLYDFEADESDPEQISVKAGEKLVLVLKQDDGWAQVTRQGDPTICIVPANYISDP